jgi:hypothetical protein
MEVAFNARASSYYILPVTRYDGSRVVRNSSAREISSLGNSSIAVEKAFPKALSACTSVFLTTTSDYRTQAPFTCTTCRASLCSLPGLPLYLPCRKGIAVVNANRFSPSSYKSPEDFLLFLAIPSSHAASTSQSASTALRLRSRLWRTLSSRSQTRPPHRTRRAIHPARGQRAVSV